MIQEGGLPRKVFVIFNNIFLFLMIVVTLYPVWLTFITSISNGLEVMKGGVGHCHLQQEAGCVHQVPGLVLFRSGR